MAKPLSKAQRLAAQSGFTAVELMIVITLLAILVSVGVPALGQFTDKNKVISAAEKIHADLQYTRTESIKRQDDLWINFTRDGTNAPNGSTSWGYGINENSGCDYTLATASNINACALNASPDGSSSTHLFKRTLSADFPGVKLVSVNFGGDNETQFDSTRGTTTSGTIIVRSPFDRELRVSVTVLGHVSICSPSGANNISSYPTC